MKNLFNILLLIAGVSIATSCSTQNYRTSGNVQALLESQHFTFMAERANPTNLDVINVMNSLPTGGASRMLNLDAGYTIEIRDKELSVTLPYFGRLYTSNMDPDKNSYRFTSTDFSINRRDGKKGSSIFTILANDQQNIRQINMEVFKNGKTYVYIDANDRQPISYDGYITENTVLKK